MILATVANMTPVARALLRGYARGDDTRFACVVERLTTDDDYAVIAKRHGVSRWAIMRWVKEYRALATQTCKAENIQPREMVRATV